jgi:hypothetical protein
MPLFRLRIYVKVFVIPQLFSKSIDIWLWNKLKFDTLLWEHNRTLFKAYNCNHLLAAWVSFGRALMLDYINRFIIEFVSLSLKSFDVRIHWILLLCYIKRICVVTCRMAVMIIVCIISQIYSCIIISLYMYFNR